MPPEERAALRQLLAGGTAPTRTLMHARILVKADAVARGPRWTDAQIADALAISLANRLVELEIVDGIAPETVRQTLKKTRSNRG